MSIFNRLSYKEYINDEVKNGKLKEKGAYTKIAKELNVHTTLISQIFKRDKDLTVEQGMKLCEYIGLTSLETGYFITLINIERAGTTSLKKFYKSQLEEIKKKSKKIAERIPAKTSLKESEELEFYSHWYYSAIRNLTAIKKFQEISKIQDHFGLPRRVVQKVVNFLLKCKLCIKDKDKVKIGPMHTHVSTESGNVWKHHLNWRIKSLERYGHLEDHETIFTSPMTVSKEDSELIREKVLSLIEEIREIVRKTEPEVLTCLNIDWFEVKK